ncbi:SDR family NAD(P)-dependent oxidoreductase [uncultured Friedmanniella sp.]|uniref:SDR family NAD(P)-dependent oxidoreductase n=1 Tax=uncultured Friedmanniella sp. TaxID=335381 RepID=UPI0035CB1C43
MTAAPTAPDRPLALVTGASSGIGAASARRLAADGYRVVCAARRQERIEVLAAEIGGTALACDVTDAGQVAALAAAVGPSLDLLVNNAGLALGMEPVAEADLDSWQTMYAVNVLGAAAVTKAVLPALVQAHGQIIVMTSTAADLPYEGGAGYCGAKAAERAMTGALRLELYDTDVRIAEICPGMVRTDEFAVNRFDGDATRAAKVYEGVTAPLTAEDVADCVGWVAGRPHHVNIDRLTVRPRAQAAQHKVHRVVG